MKDKNKVVKYIIIRLSSIIIITSVVLLIMQVDGSYISVSDKTKILKVKQLELIKKDIKLDLPSSAKVTNFSYYKDSGSFEAKIYLDEQNINEVKKKLNNYFGGELTKPYDMWHFENTCSWWDLKEKNVNVSYRTIVGERNGSDADPSYTRNVWAFITKDDQGKHYLYISY